MRVNILYNPLSNNGHGDVGVELIKKFYPDAAFSIMDVREVEDYNKYFDSLAEDELFILCGGDGTLHHFVNDTDGIVFDRDIYFFPAGSGNDFINDIGRTQADGPFVLNEYIKNLPFVTVNGKTSRFINNVGYGIDGYCCEVADIQRTTSKKKINYTAIALKGLMGGYIPANAVVIIDGQRKTYKDAWLAPTMKGRFCGGGMMLAPGQDRLDPERKVCVPVMYNVGKFKALWRFKTVFKGEHVKYKDMVDVTYGHTVEVNFDTPCALQIDGETVLGVYKYTVSTS